MIAADEKTHVDFRMFSSFFKSSYPAYWLSFVVTAGLTAAGADPTKQCEYSFPVSTLLLPLPF